MPLPTLNHPHWDATRVGLQRAAQIVASLQKAHSPALPNALHLALLPRSFGLATRPLTFGEAALDFTTGTLRLSFDTGVDTIALDGLTPLQVYEQAKASLTAHGVETDAAAPHDAADQPIALDLGVAAEYAEGVWGVHGVIARLRAEWFGTVSPVVVWPHGFDLSTLYFGLGTPDEHHTPHINIGFSPASAGFARPYVYAYGWPLPADLTDARLPQLARWHTTGWTGAVMDYDSVAAMADPEAALLEALRGVVGVLRRVLA
ncbi:MAG: DUF5996 family protein [Anaerolineae bacterium]|jgi:hypothetical protein|nr:DUF5996 family protein [Anaerolineae bacterium]